MLISKRQTAARRSIIKPKPTTATNNRAEGDHTHSHFSKQNSTFLKTVEYGRQKVM
ncbi:hypothetical protein EXN66_Car000099 [Channa argus]|uniref:Uncharacterized protein n=1 Tax=Channa argus TaxID=215402 RepID=A0A6G1QXI5_CHAAH|nr:hypothetical protein EXN66_Car000099 [Channa argus]